MIIAALVLFALWIAFSIAANVIAKKSYGKAYLDHNERNQI